MNNDKLIKALVFTVIANGVLSLALIFAVVSNKDTHRDDLSLYAQRISGKFKKIESFLNEKKGLEEGCAAISKEFYNNARVEVDFDKNLNAHCHITGEFQPYVGTNYELRQAGYARAMREFYLKHKDKK